MAIAHGTTRRDSTARRGSGAGQGSTAGWGRAVRWGVDCALGAVLLAGAPGCARAPAAVPVPVFPPASAAPTSTPSRPDAAGHLPTDCEDVVGHDELPALFGLPVGSVTVRTVQGVPAPSVGRLERVDCTYTVVDPGAPPQGVVLRMTLGRYADRAAARDQHDRNVVDAGAAAVGQPGLGDAAAALVRRGTGTILLTCWDVVTVDLDLAPRPVPLPPGDLLADLARRVLARTAPAAPATGPQAG